MSGAVTTEKTSQPKFRQPDQVRSEGNSGQHRTVRRRNAPSEKVDRLSRVPLVKNALRELDRQNATLTPVFQNLENHPSYSSVEQFARHGGPDLSDLRGVC